MKSTLYGHMINQIARLSNKRLNEKISKWDIYSSQWGILLYLYDKKQCTQVELSKYLNVEAPTITRTLKRMETSNWIKRTVGHDKREKKIELTDKSYSMFEELNQASNEIEEIITNNISQNDLEIFNKTLYKIMKNLE